MFCLFLLPYKTRSNIFGPIDLYKKTYPCSTQNRVSSVSNATLSVVTWSKGTIQPFSSSGAAPGGSWVPSVCVSFSRLASSFIISASVAGFSTDRTAWFSDMLAFCWETNANGKLEDGSKVWMKITCVHEAALLSNVLSFFLIEI